MMIWRGAAICEHALHESIQESGGFETTGFKTAVFMGCGRRSGQKKRCALLRFPDQEIPGFIRPPCFSSRSIAQK